MYPYYSSPSDSYYLLRDGVEVISGSEAVLWQYLLDNHSYSVFHALTQEGYTIIPAENLTQLEPLPEREGCFNNKCEVCGK